jgi:DNA mismatch repair protein MutS2
MQKIYPENFEVKIGFDRIREMLQAKCLSNMGIEWVDEMLFQDSFENIQNQLGETDEFCRIIREFDSFPASHFYDLRSALQKIKIEGRFLETTELFDLKRSLESVRAIVFFLINRTMRFFRC